MPDRQPKYVKSEAHGRLWQCEILTNVTQILARADSVGEGDEVLLREINHPYAVVMSQDCDLETDFARRFRGSTTGSELPCVLLCYAENADVMRGRIDAKSSAWSQIRNNNNERYQCLEAVPPSEDFLSEGLEAIGIDFKRYFAIPTDELYKRIELGHTKKRSRCGPIYAQHLAVRFFYYQFRVALPENHSITPTG